MGMIVDKAKIVGVFGGITKSKSGKTFLAVFSPGPKVDKFCLSSPGSIQGNASFGDMVTVEFLEAEQKFSDFNGSYTVVKAAKITVNSK